jgi:hypothetical protein
MKIAPVVLFAIALSACAPSERAVVVPVVLDRPPSLPVPKECRASARKKFPRLLIPERSSALPMEMLESRWLDGRFAHADNDTLALVCECFIVDAIGTPEEKSEAAPRCEALRTGAKTQ